MQVNLLPHQLSALHQTQSHNRCAYYLDMGLGKTFVGSEKMFRLGETVNLIVCQKSKVNDWLEHIQTYYSDFQEEDGTFTSATALDLTKPKQYALFFELARKATAKSRPFVVGVINYDLLIRRQELSNLRCFTAVFDESSMLKNESSKRTKFALTLQADNVVLLSGTPVGGKYEELWSQCMLLGWNISKDTFYNRFIVYREWQPAPYARAIKLVNGYKNVPELKQELHKYGAVFLQSSEVLTLPIQSFQTIWCKPHKQYAAFMTDGVVQIEQPVEVELVGDTQLTKLLYARQLCSGFSESKLQAFVDWINSNNTRLVVFYNFNIELESMLNAIKDSRPISIVNGERKDLLNYERFDNSVTFIQYQAGAFGLNLQKANYIGYYSLPLSSELYEQSKKRIHRIGQSKPCFYYLFICKGTVEEHIKQLLDMRNDYTLELFDKVYLS